MKGVLICGGTGSRMLPLTDVTHKSLLPVYDKPLILYPLEVLLKARTEEIIIITGPEKAGEFMQFLGSGERWNAKFTYRIQERPEGIAQALGMAGEFVGEDSVCMILGDNVFFDDLRPVIHSFRKGGHIFVKEVPDPERFGVVELEGDRVTSIEEKPAKPKSNFVQTGCYLYDARCFNIIRRLRPSSRGELEITDVTKWYLQRGELTATILSDDWIDAGTCESLFRAASLIRERKKIDQGVPCRARRIAPPRQPSRSSVRVSPPPLRGVAGERHR